MPINMIDKATGQAVPMTAEQAEQAFKAGTHGLPGGQQVPIRAPDHSLGKLDPEKSQGALAQGAHFIDPEEYRAAELHEKYGGLGATVAAGGEALARGVSVGLSDPIAVGVGRLVGGDKTAEAVRQHLADEREEHPYLSTGMEALGAVAPVLLSGGEAAAPEAAVLGADAARTARALSGVADGVRTLGVVPRGIAAAGDAAEGLAARMLGATSETTLGKAGQAAAKMAARSVAEGGLFGAGQAESDATLENKPLTVEKLTTSIGHSALYAGAIGLGLGGLGSLAAEGGQRLLGALAPKLDDMAGEQAFKWLAPKNAVTKEAIARGGGESAVGQTLMDEVIRPTVEEKGLAALRMDPDEKVAAIEKAVEKKGAEIGAKVDGFPSATIPLADMIAPIDQRIASFANKVGGEDKVAGLQKLKTSLYKVFGGAPDLGELTAMGRTAAADAGLKSGTEAWTQYVDDYVAQGMSEHAARLDEMQVPLAKAIEQRRALQQITYEETKALDPKLRVQLLRQVTGVRGDLEEKALNEASKDMGGAAGDELRALNKQFQQLKIAEDAARSTQASYATNRNFSLTDYGVGLSGAHALMGGHPAGALGIGGMLLHRELRHHANAYAAILLDRLGTMGGLSRAVQEVDEQVDRAVSQAVSSKRPRLGRVYHGSTDKRYEEEKGRVQQIAALTSAAAGAHLDTQYRALQTHLPDTAAAAQEHAKTVAAFLASKLPHQEAPLSATPQLDKRVESAEDKARFLRYVDAAEGGMPHVMKRLAAGRLTPEDMETAEQCFPHSLAEGRAKVSASLAERTKPVDYQRKLQLTMFMGQPMDATLAPKFIYGMQDTLAKAMPAPKPPAQQQPKSRRGAASSRVSQQVAKSMQTPTERAMESA